MIPYFNMYLLPVHHLSQSISIKSTMHSEALKIGSVFLFTYFYFVNHLSKRFQACSIRESLKLCFWIG